VFHRLPTARDTAGQINGISLSGLPNHEAHQMVMALVRSGSAVTVTIVRCLADAQQAGRMQSAPSYNHLKTRGVPQKAAPEPHHGERYSGMCYFHPVLPSSCRFSRRLWSSHAHLLTMM